MKHFRKNPSIVKASTDYQLMMKQYKYNRKFKNRDDAALAELLEELDNKQIPHDMYVDKKEGGCTVFWDDTDQVPLITSSKRIRSSVRIIYPWKMVGEYEDGSDAEVGGFDEYDCMQKLIDLQDVHGELTWYSGFNDEDYVDGEYVGRDNFI